MDELGRNDLVWGCMDNVCNHKGVGCLLVLNIDLQNFDRPPRDNKRFLTS